MLLLTRDSKQITRPCCSRCVFLRSKAPAVSFKGPPVLQIIGYSFADIHRQRQLRILANRNDLEAVVINYMHGVDPSVIALWLGHESVETTHGYVEADLAMMENVLSKLAPSWFSTSALQARRQTLGIPADALAGWSFAAAMSRHISSECRRRSIGSAEPLIVKKGSKDFGPNVSGYVRAVLRLGKKPHQKLVCCGGPVLDC